jgi:hypothetical protein
MLVQILHPESLTEEIQKPNRTRFRNTTSPSDGLGGLSIASLNDVVQVVAHGDE